jgi:hypothetical protein
MNFNAEEQWHSSNSFLFLIKNTRLFYYCRKNQVNITNKKKYIYFWILKLFI